MLKRLTRDRSLLVVLLIYSIAILIECLVVFLSVNSYPELHNLDSQLWDGYRRVGATPKRFYFFGLERTVLLLLLPIGVITAWLTWHLLGYRCVSYAFIPHHKGTLLAKLAPHIFRERPNQGYLIVEGAQHGKSLRSIVKASTLPFSLLLSISILLVKDVFHAFPSFYVARPFSIQVMILMPCTIFINFALYIVLPVLALVTASIWILEGSGLRYHDTDKKTVVEVAADYRVAIHSFTGIGAALSFLSLLYEIMITHGLEFSYIISYLSFTTLFLYPPTLLVTALYIHFSEAQSIEKTLRKMRNQGFSLPKASSIETN